MYTKVIIADGNDFRRNGLIATINSSKSLRVVGSVVEGQKALKLIAKVKPDIAILDAEMPNMSGYEVPKTLTEINSKIKVIIISTYNDDITAANALLKGASAFISHKDHVKEFMRTLEGLQLDCCLLKHSTLKTLVHSFNIKIRASKNSGNGIKISELQVRALQLKNEGKRDKEIAAILFRHPRTVQDIFRRLREKSGTHNYHQLLLWADKFGLLAA